MILTYVIFAAWVVLCGLAGLYLRRRIYRRGRLIGFTDGFVSGVRAAMSAVCRGEDAVILDLEDEVVQKPTLKN